jgi:hypothetical protein
MCTFENNHGVLVCDVAIARVREAASRAFGDAVRLTPVPGQGTLVEVPPTEVHSVYCPGMSRLYPLCSPHSSQAIYRDSTLIWAPAAIVNSIHRRGGPLTLLY